MEKYCQSCGMPLVEEADFGTNADGSKSEDYCVHCYTMGNFNSPDETMEEMIETCIPFVSNGNPYPNAEEARKSMLAFFPTLKRWKK